MKRRHRDPHIDPNWLMSVTLTATTGDNQQPAMRFFVEGRMYKIFIEHVWGQGEVVTAQKQAWVAQLKEAKSEGWHITVTFCTLQGPLGEVTSVVGSFPWQQRSKEERRRLAVKKALEYMHPLPSPDSYEPEYLPRAEWSEDRLRRRNEVKELRRKFWEALFRERNTHRDIESYEV